MVVITTVIIKSEGRRQRRKQVKDRAALKKVRHGDESAIAQLIARYTAYVATIVRGIIGKGRAQEDVEEIVADVFVALWQNADKPYAGKLKAWLGAVARNKAKNRLLTLVGTLPLEEDFLFAEGASEDPEQVMLKHEEANLVRCALGTMKSTDREVFVRHYYDIQTVAHIANDMGLSESAIKLRLLRGRKKLQKTLIERGYGR